MMQERPDAHARPPESVRELYKHYQKLPVSKLQDDPSLICLEDGHVEGISPVLQPNDLLDIPSELRTIFLDFLHSSDNAGSHGENDMPQHITARVYAVPSIPGLFIYPSLLPQQVQIGLLDRCLHRDLSNSQHQTNIHMHYRVPYPGECNSKTHSFFDPSSMTLEFSPKDTSLHQSFTTPQFLNKKLRWMTLGGQYDWTNKVYPETAPPSFPSDTKKLIEDLFPMKAEAAIVNLYSPGNTLSLHRDVSEECNQPLASVSLGCDAIFIIGLADNDICKSSSVAALRLRSGDAVLMSGESRYAWHGVPKVIEDTCPEWMREWPCSPDEHGDDAYEKWRGWMNGKRINLNVRQMFD